ncbi:hypothetical protein [Croceicoccus bisphenolivorans]|uniref:hypothetical protein n=1 Tax=Croceicoccus bisphenolivorans TaxID=1783232 RepID=UPI000B259A9C|nr:hypothetical protein [Croceicoccus bisphenolivorans]
MEKFRIELSDDRTGKHETIRFEAEDASGALNVLSTHDTGYHAELWQDGELVCKLSQNAQADDVWLVNA